VKPIVNSNKKKHGPIPIFTPYIDKVLYLFVSSRAKMVSTLSMSSLAVIVMFMEGGSQVIPAQNIPSKIGQDVPDDITSRKKYTSCSQLYRDKRLLKA
jgi:hypothetical protein